MRKRTSMFIVCMLLFIFIISAPLLAPIVHDDHSPKSAVRNYIQQAGHPYQSFFAVIRNTNTIDPQHGNLYDVLWNDWDNETGSTGQLCYAKESGKDIYTISCGTGP